MWKGPPCRNRASSGVPPSENPSGEAGDRSLTPLGPVQLGRVGGAQTRFPHRPHFPLGPPLLDELSVLVPESFRSPERRLAPSSLLGVRKSNKYLNQGRGYLVLPARMSPLRYRWKRPSAVAGRLQCFPYRDGDGSRLRNDEKAKKKI